jgi:SAM-dependent methyltransferase
MTGHRSFPASDAARTMLARYVSGSGLEMGPGHQPFPLRFPGVSVRYVDRWDPIENAGLFPELGDDVSFPQPDIVSDLNIEGLSMVADESEDFVIASHVLEHLTDPIAQLADIHRVLRPGGVALILLPDRRRTFDRARQGTTLEHLLADHAAGMKVPDDEHIEEFLIYTEGWNAERDAATRDATFEHHRKRSFHVHCWTQQEFLAVLRYAITDMGMSWELIDALFADDVTEGIEYGFVLRRSLGPSDAAALAKRLDAVWAVFEDARRPAPPSRPGAPLWRQVATRVLPAQVRRRLRAVRNRW